MKNIFWVVGIVALVIMVRSFGLDEIMHNLKSIGWGFLFILFIWLVTYVLNAVAWYMIICENKQIRKRLPFLYILKLTITGYAINYTTPVGLMGGEPYRVIELRRFVGTGKATASVILYSMMHIFSHILFWVTSVFLAIWILPMDNTLAYVLGATFVLCSVITFLFIKACTKGMVLSSLGILSRMPLLGRRIAGFTAKHIETIEIIDNQISRLHKESKLRFYMPLLIELVARVFACLEIFLIVWFAGEHLTFLQCVLSVAFSSLFANIFFFSPLQLGTREGGFMLALKALSLSAGLGLFVSMMTRIREFIWIAIGMLIMKVERTSVTQAIQENQIVVPAVENEIEKKWEV
ncbi:MAG: lysylphosphatidylglycerol synthase domain-containing protein [Bacteroidales bacterium]|nr:lysylphosphatidylglycerol synthase domain-containing protein [Bacteroidales bacterium]